MLSQPPMIGPQSPELSDTGVSNESQLGGRSSKTSGIAVISRPQIDKNCKTQPEMQPPMSPITKANVAIADNPLGGDPTEAPKELTVETSVGVDTRANSNTPTQPNTETTFQIGVETPRFGLGTSIQLEIETSKEPDGEPSKSPGTETLKQPNKRLDIKTKKQPPSRRSSRISTAPTRYTDTISPTPTHTTPETQWERAPKSTHTKGSLEPKGSQISPTPIKHSASTKGYDSPTEEAAVSFTPRGSDRLRKRRRDEEPSTETEFQPLNALDKKLKPSPKALGTATPNASNKTRGPTAARSTTRKTRSQSSLSTTSVNAAKPIEPPLTKASAPPITRPKFSFAKLKVETLRTFLEDAMSHYSRLPKNLTDPDGVGALYRTFFPTSTYQGYAKALELGVDDGNLREMMRMVWEMVNGGEDDAVVVWEKLGVAWTEGKGE